MDPQIVGKTPLFKPKFVLPHPQLHKAQLLDPAPSHRNPKTKSSAALPKTLQLKSKKILDLTIHKKYFQMIPMIQESRNHLWSRALQVLIKLLILKNLILNLIHHSNQNMVHKLVQSQSICQSQWFIIINDNIKSPIRNHRLKSQ